MMQCFWLVSGGVQKSSEKRKLAVLRGVTQQIRTQLTKWRILTSRKVGVTRGGVPFYINVLRVPPADMPDSVRHTARRTSPAQDPSRRHKQAHGEQWGGRSGGRAGQGGAGAQTMRVRRDGHATRVGQDGAGGRTAGGGERERERPVQAGQAGGQVRGRLGAWVMQVGQHRRAGQTGDRTVRWTGTIFQQIQPTTAPSRVGPEAGGL